MLYVLERAGIEFVPYRLPDLQPGSCYFIHFSEYPCGIDAVFYSECVDEQPTKRKRQTMGR